jgi:hypothetical protein
MPSVRESDRPLGERVLPGLHLAVRCLQRSMQDLCNGAPFPSIDTRRLCAASLSAGRVIGYLEALEAADITIAREMARELEGAFRSVEAVRRQFGGGPSQP